MNASPLATLAIPQHPTQSPAKPLRAFSISIPLRWRATILLIATIIFFPVFIAVIVIDTLTQDMPKVRSLMSRAGHMLNSWGLF